LTVTQPIENTPARLPVVQRLLLVLLGLFLLALLSVAVYLQPSGRGYGTHEQLGLPPCTFTAVFNRRCPSCGMTTSWSHLVRGQVIRAVQANTGGALLAAAAVAAVPWSLISATRGRWLVRPPGEWTIAIAAATFVAVTLVDWFVRLLI